MMYSRLNKMEYGLNEMIENCHYIYSMDAANTLEFGYVVTKGP